MLGTWGTVGAANAYNCIWEYRSDALMPRTAGRPLPTQRLDLLAAMVFATALALVSLPTLFLGVNALCGFLGLGALLSYVAVYTPLKSRTWWAMMAGAVPGAAPPLMGWAAATGGLAEGGIALFAILFVWQLAHFVAIAVFRKDEYRRAGLTNLPIARGDRAALWHAVTYTVLLVPVSALPFVVGLSGMAYLAVILPLGVAFVGFAVKGFWSPSLRDWGRRLFFASLVDLTTIFVALGVDGLIFP